MRSKTLGEDMETFPSLDALQPNCSEDLKLSDDCTTNTSSINHDNSSNTTDLESPENRNDQEERMEGDINLWEFLHPAPSDILFEDMSENNQIKYNKGLGEGISRLPSPDAFSNNSSPDNYYCEYNTATTDNAFSLPSLNTNKTKSFRTSSTRRQSHAIDSSPPSPHTMLRYPDTDTDTDTDLRSRPPRASKTKTIELLQARLNTLPDDAREIPFRQLPNVQLRIARSTIENNAGTGLFLLQVPQPDGSERAEDILGTYERVCHTDPDEIERLRSPQIESDYLYKATDPHTGTTVIIDASAPFSCYGRYVDNTPMMDWTYMKQILNLNSGKWKTVKCEVTHHYRPRHGTVF